MPWRVLAIGLAICTVAATSTLVVVGLVRDVQALETVAIALAIVAFLLQILIFIAQTWTSTQQVGESQRLNLETQALLSELRGITQGTHGLVRDQMKSMTDALTGQLSVLAVERQRRAGEGDVGNLPDSIESLVERAVSYRLDPLDDFEFDEEDVPVPSDDDIQVLERLRSFPDEEEGLKLLGVLEAVSPLAVSWLRRYAENERDARQIARAPGMWLRSTGAPFTEELQRAGLVVIEDPPADANDIGLDRWARLTQLGREVSRLLLGVGEVPDYLTSHHVAQVDPGKNGS